MLSRVAETIYWVGRHLERTENTARIINVNGNLMLDLPRGVSLGWEPLIWILGCDAEYLAKNEEFSERRVVNYLISDLDNPGSILSTLANAREGARTIREILPHVAWEELNRLNQYAIEARQLSHSRQGRQEYLRSIIAGLQQHVGLLAGTMNHDLAYNFLNLGRKLERADMTSRIIHTVTLNPISEEGLELSPFANTIWMSMLESLGAYQMYRQAMQPHISRSQVLLFMFRKKEFPRSMAYSIENMAFNLSALPNNARPLKILRQIERVIMESPASEMADDPLHAFVDELQIRLGKLHDTIAKTYFPLASAQAA
jgi:uncharacterized alpha-E superfamily protein